MNFLIQGGCVLTLGHRTQNFHAADVLVEDGVITEIGLGLRAKSAVEVDASNAIVMPGFVDAHRRCRQALYKNEGATGTGNRGDQQTPSEVYSGTLLALFGAAEAGITSVVDWYDGPDGGEYLDASIQAHMDAPIRTVLVLASGDDRAALWRNAVAKHGGKPSRTTTLAAGMPSLATTSNESFGSLFGAARSSGMRIHAIATPEDGGKISDLERLGLLGHDVTFAHCTGLPDADLDALASAGAGVVLTPTSDMTNGPGTPPMQALLDRGLDPGLGVDDDFQGPGDVLAQMRAAISVQHARYFDLKLAGKGGLPNLLSTRNVIRYGTVSGAHAVGLADETGSLEVGKQADLILLRVDRPNIHPVNDPIGAVVWGIDTSNIDFVLVGGETVMEGGALTGDIERLRSLVGNSVGAGSET